MADKLSRILFSKSSMGDNVVEQLSTADVFDDHVAIARVGVVQKLDELHNVGMIQHLQNCLLTLDQLLLGRSLDLFVFEDLDSNLARRKSGQRTCIQGKNGSMLVVQVLLQVEASSVAVHTFSFVKMLRPSFTLPKVPSPSFLPIYIAKGIEGLESGWRLCKTLNFSHARSKLTA